MPAIWEKTTTHTTLNIRRIHKKPLSQLDERGRRKRGIIGGETTKKAGTRLLPPNIYTVRIYVINFLKNIGLREFNHSAFYVDNIAFISKNAEIDGFAAS